MSDISKSAPKCLYCGNNPVPHRMTYLSQSLGAYFGARKGRRPMSTIERFMRAQEDWVIRMCFAFFRLLWIGRFLPTGEPISDRSRVIWDEAKQRGMTI